MVHSALTPVPYMSIDKPVTPDQSGFCSLLCIESALTIFPSGNRDEIQCSSLYFLYKHNPLNGSKNHRFETKLNRNVYVMKCVKKKNCLHFLVYYSIFRFLISFFLPTFKQFLCVSQHRFPTRLIGHMPWPLESPRRAQN